MILSSDKRKLRRLTKNLVGIHLRHLPWRTMQRLVSYPDGTFTMGLVYSSEAVINGLKLSVGFEYHTGVLNIAVYVDNKIVYPGGQYWILWAANPWRWEWRLWKRIYSAPDAGTRENLIQTLNQKTPTNRSGKLSLVPKEEDHAEQA